MSAKSKTFQAIAIAVVLAAAIIGGVTLTQQNFFNSQSTKNGSTQPVLQTGTLAAQITDPPNVPIGVTHVYLNYSDIQVHLAGVPDNSGWYTVANSGAVDLMSVVNVSMTLGSSTVSSGVFTLVKFDNIGAKITYFGQNYSALVPQSQLVCEISNGGVSVSSNGSSGFVVDISPTVFQNDTHTGFVLTPAATCLPISQQIWQKGWEQEGTVVNMNSSDWLKETDHQGSLGNVSIVSASLTSNSFEIKVTNTGNVNTNLTSLSILSGGATQSGDTMLPDGIMSVYGSTIAIFQILSNGNVTQPHSLDTESGDYSGYLLRPGQSVTLSYHGTIVGLPTNDNGSLGPNAMITAGLLYTLKVTTSVGTYASYPISATSG